MVSWTYQKASVGCETGSSNKVFVPQTAVVVSSVVVTCIVITLSGVA
jgi:hypothetical protein